MFKYSNKEGYLGLFSDFITDQSMRVFLRKKRHMALLLTVAGLFTAYM